MIRKIKTSLTAKLFLATTVLLILVCLLSVFSMARYIPQTYSNRLSAELQKQANDLVPVLEKAGSLVIHLFSNSPHRQKQLPILKMIMEIFYIQVTN